MGKQREGGHNSLTYTQGIDTISLNSLLILNHDEGRRLKTKLRLGCHPLRSLAARMSITRNATCSCCGHGSETITHTIFECPKLDDIRGFFFQKLSSDLRAHVLANSSCRPGPAAVSPCTITMDLDAITCFMIDRLSRAPDKDVHVPRVGSKKYPSYNVDGIYS